MTEVAAAIAALIFLGGNLPGRCFFFLIYERRNGFKKRIKSFGCVSVFNLNFFLELIKHRLSFFREKY